LIRDVTKEIGAPDNRIKRSNEHVLTPRDLKSLAQLLEHMIITELTILTQISLIQKNLKTW